MPITAEKKLATGYKQTEIGTIPEDWDIKTLGDIGDIKMCRRVFNHETKETGAIPFYKIGTFGKEADAYISQNLYDNYRHKFSFPNKGDVLISAAGTIGRTIVYDGKPAYFQDSNIVWIDNNERLISNSYLYYVLQVAKYNTEGGTIQRLYNSIIKSAKFICPTKSQQTAIVSILSDTDALIEKLKAFIEKKKRIKQGTMQELFSGRKRLPGFTREWKLKKLGSIGKTYGGLVGKTKSDFGKGDGLYIPFLNILNNPVINPSFLDIVNIRPTENQNKAKKGDLFFNGSSETPEEVGMCSVLANDISNLHLNSFCFGFRFNEEIETVGLFYSYYFRSSVGRQLIFSLAQGATRYNLSKTNFLELIIPYPELQEQIAIANILSDMDAEIEKLESQLFKYQNIKQGIMQTLLTGKIRLISK